MKIKKILISQAVPGMICAGDIYAYNNLLIISINTPLTDRIITRLQFYSVEEFPVFIEEDPIVEDEPIITKEALEQPFNDTAVNIEWIKRTPEFKRFNETFLNTVDDFSSELSALALDNATINIEKLVSNCSDILSNCRNGIHVFDMLHCIRDYNDLTYVHSINVSLICNTIGVWLNLPQEELDAVTIAGLLHDVGKLLLPQELINKPNKLTDEEFKLIKTHTTKGYQLLKKQDIDKRIIHAALMHHERCDGSGYPNGFTRHNIDSFAKIVAIADVYDAMTSARVYRGPLCPFEIISLFEKEGLTKYDPTYLLAFLEGVAQSYTHKQVRLSNGMEGEIVLINKNNLSKPVVHVEYAFIDLSKRPDLSIVAIL